MAWRRIDRTVTRNGKHVIIMARPGARLSTVIRAISWKVRALSDPSSPSEIDKSWANAPIGNAINKVVRNSLTNLGTCAYIQDLDQPDNKLPRVFALGFLQSPARYQLVSDI